MASTAAQSSEDGYRRSFEALKPGGPLIVIGYSAGAEAKQGMLAVLANVARLYLWGWMPFGRRTRFYSINVMRARHPDWFKQDLAQLLELLSQHRIEPRISDRLPSTKSLMPTGASNQAALKARSCCAREKAEAVSPAFGIAALEAIVAAFDFDQGRCPALRALGHRLACATCLKGIGRHGLCEKPSEVPLDDVADRREQRRDVAPLHPGAAARIEHRL